MKPIKSLMRFFALMLLVSFINNLKAQGNEMMNNRKEVAEERFKKLSDKLQLTPEQQTKVMAIEKESRIEMKQLRESKKDASKEEKRMAMVAQLKKTNNQINAILTPKQQELFTQYKAEKKANRQAKMKERHKEKEMIEDERLF